MKRKTAVFISFLLLFQLIIPFGFGFEILYHDMNNITSKSTDIPYQNGWPQQTEKRIIASPVFADLNEDGTQEIIIGSGVVGDSNQKIYVFQSNGDVMNGWPIDIAEYIQSPAVGDLDGDGDLEIVVISSYGYIYAWHHDGSVMDGWPKEGGATTSPTLFDIDNDGDLEIIRSSIDRTYVKQRARLDVSIMMVQLWMVGL